MDAIITPGRCIAFLFGGLVMACGGGLLACLGVSTPLTESLVPAGVLVFGMGLGMAYVGGLRKRRAEEICKALVGE
ncbi:MAG: hypothetical protein WC343_11050 [Bacilli bacterium]